MHDERLGVVVPQVLGKHLALALVVPPTMMELLVVLADQVLKVRGRTLVGEEGVQLVLQLFADVRRLGLGERRQPDVADVVGAVVRVGARIIRSTVRLTDGPLINWANRTPK